jgi:hypothetical protein
MIKIKKPPLHKKFGPQIEDFIKLADEGIASINHELVPEKKIQSNFNLSVNNSFNTSINEKGKT